MQQMHDIEPLLQLFGGRGFHRWRHAWSALETMAQPCHHILKAEWLSFFAAVAIDIDEYPGGNTGPPVFAFLLTPMPHGQQVQFIQR
jgi:hypothetical protein